MLLTHKKRVAAAMRAGGMMDRRWMLLAAGLTMAIAGVGCTTPNISKTSASLADQPRADEATQLRGFTKSVAHFQTGTTQGYPTRWYYAPYPETPTAANVVVDSGAMIVQTITLPAVLLVDYPFRKVYYEGDVLPPSYTAMPPVNPEKAFGPPNPDPDPVAMGRAPLLPPLPPVPVEHPKLMPRLSDAPPVAPLPPVTPKPITPAQIPAK